MENNKNFIAIFWVTLILIVVFFGWYYYNGKRAIQNNNGNSTQATTTSTLNVGQKITATINNSSATTIQTAPKKVNMPAPSLDRPIPDTSKMDSGMVSRIEMDMQTAITNLRKNSNSFYDWIDLGFDRKVLADYQGASEAWQYVSLLYPENTISFSDLGDLYTSYLEDNIKAELNYQTAIKNAPTNIDSYRNLYNLYISENKNTEAVAILEKGIIANPKTYDLSLLLARYYRDAGNTSQAKIYYDKAIVAAQKQNNTSLAQALQDEENSLK